jgi:hypothetical protein
VSICEHCVKGRSQNEGEVASGNQSLLYIRARAQIRSRGLRCTRQFSLRRSACELKVRLVIIIVVARGADARCPRLEIDSTCGNAYTGRSHITFGSDDWRHRRRATANCGENCLKWSLRLMATYLRRRRSGPRLRCHTIRLYSPLGGTATTRRHTR